MAPRIGKHGEILSHPYVPQEIRNLKPYWQRSKPTAASVFVGDCVKILNEFPRSHFDLIFADPPFNIGYGYDVYEDVMDDEEYLSWTGKWLTACKRVLNECGSIYVAITPKYQAEMKLLMDEVGFNWRSTICWHYTFGPNQKTNFTPSWVAIHYYTNSKKIFTWNSNEIAVPSARMLKYGDRRANPQGKMPDNVWVLLPDEYEHCFVDSQDSFLESRVCGTFKERVQHPCQMPEAVLDRIVRASSRKGATVLDPFVGSGTTGAVCMKSGRNFVGIDLSENYVKQIVIPRLEEI